MRQAIGDAYQSQSAATKDPALLFRPHLVPMSRGIVASVAVPVVRPVDAAEARELYGTRYEGRPFVRLLEGEALPETRHVRGSNRCDLAIRVGAGGSMLLVYAAIDNLVKGAAGQAIQNCNVLMGWPEAAGLPLEGWPVA
jgi:N-acetyl-gamma-glutamyl-phosphate reductase